MSLKRQAILGVKWSFIQQFSVQIINFAVQVILARLLMPEMFGLIAMITVFISIGQSLMDSGMTSSLIRTENPTQTDYSTVFTTNMVMSIAIYATTFILAPYIANFYEQEVLTDIVRLFAVSFIINAFVAVHIAKLTKEMNFKQQMKLQIPSTLISGLVGVTMAYIGYGVWSLVWMNLTRSLLLALQLWIFLKWKPSIIFNKKRFLYHFKFGYKLTLSGLIDTIYNDSYRIIIGKFFNPAAVGYFNHAETMRLFPVNQISSVMSKVTYPYFSGIKNDTHLKSAYNQSMKLVLLVVVPMMITLIIIAKELFIFMFGEKWLPSVPYFQILAIASIIRPISSYNLNILKVKGQSNTFLKVEIYKKILGILSLVIGLQFGLLGLVISLTLVSFIWVFINMYFCGKLINFSLAEQLRTISPIMVIGSVSGILSYYIYSILIELTSNNFVIIILVSITNLILYLILIYLVDKKLLISVRKLLKNG